MRSIVFVFLILFGAEASSQTIFARLSGDWDQTNAWSTIGPGGASCGCVPGVADEVVIDGFDIDIDAGTGDVTVSSVLITNSLGTDVRLRIQDGTELTVTNDFEIESDVSGLLSELTVEDTDSRLEISGDFIADQNDGNDLLIDIEDNGIVDIAGDAEFFQDGGDDLEININRNSGTNAQFNVTGNMLIDHDGGDDIRIRLSEASSQLNITGDLDLDWNAGTNDDFTFNLDEGDFTVTGNVTIDRTSDTGPVDFDMDGGNFSCNNITVNTGGPLGTSGSVRFFVDEDSQFDCNNFNATFSGGNDLYIYINNNAGANGTFNVSNDLTVLRSNGDNFHILLEQDGSELTVGGNVDLTTTGGDAFLIELDNDATFDITGDFDITTNTAQSAEISMAGGGDSPSYLVGGDFTWQNEIGNTDCFLDVNGGNLTIDGNLTFSNDNGGDDMDIDLDGDGEITVGLNATFEIVGGDDMRVDIGDASAGSTAIFDIGGNASFLLSSDAGPNPIWRLRVYDDTRFRVGGELDFTTDFTTTGLCLVDVQNTAEIDVDGDVDLNAISSGELELRLTGDSFFRIGGNFLRAPAPNNFGEFDASLGNGTVEYKGTAAQIIAEDAGGGGDDFKYMNIEIDNSFGTAPQLTLEGDVTVNGALIMNDGVVASDETDILIVADDGTTSGASNNSYVDGYMRKVGDDAFTFPSGDAGFYGPIGISAPGSATDAFEAQYFLVMPHLAGFDSSAHDPSVSYISKVEYWQLDRVVGASNPTVSLSWDTPRSGGVVDEADLRFMRWDGSNWDDLGAASVTGSPVSGTLDNNVAITSFSDGNPYTIGTIDPINPLPVELTVFEAVLKNELIEVYWETASEINSDYFEVERSKDGVVWETVTQLNAAGNSSKINTYNWGGQITIRRNFILQIKAS